MKKTLLFSAAAVMILAGCAKNDETIIMSANPAYEKVEGGYLVTASAVAESETNTTAGQGTKVYINNSTVLWRKDDAISVCNSANANVQMSTSESGTSSVTFSGTFPNRPAENDTWIAAYPYDSSFAATFTAASYSFSCTHVFPYAQTSGNEVQAPMIAVAQNAGSGLSFEFKNLYSIIRVPLIGNGQNVTGITISSLDASGNVSDSSPKIAGKFTISTTDSAADIASLTPVFASDGYSTIDAECLLALSSTAQTVDIFVPAVRLDNGIMITVWYYDSWRYDCKFATGGMTVERNKIYTLPAMTLPINIPNAEFRRFLAHMDEDANPGFDVTDPSTYGLLTSIEMHQNGVSDLTGLNLFPNLESLVCQNHGVTSLDISKNTKLTYLNCEGSKLTSLDVSNNTELVGLYCSFTGLGSLNVRENTNLTTLCCAFTDISSLDVSRNTLLEYLECNNCLYLKFLDVSGLQNLATLYCMDTPIATLNISGCKELNELCIDPQDAIGDDGKLTIPSALLPLKTFIADNMTLRSNGMYGWTALECVDNLGIMSISVKNHAGLTSLTATGNTALTSINVTGSTSCTVTQSGNNASIAVTQ